MSLPIEHLALWRGRSREDRIKFYRAALDKASALGPEALQLAQRRLAQSDLFFLLTVICKRKDVDHDWVFARCVEVQSEPDGYIDIWSRGHFKSSLQTFAKTIQDILCNPEITVGIFSHTRPMAKNFLRQIMTELDRNEELKGLFPDVLFADPKKQSPKWSEDEGLVVKRKTNPKESTVEAWGLSDAMPTGKHYKVLLFDDVITQKAVTNPEMVKKVTDNWALSLSLVAEHHVRRTIGTRYHTNDPYREIISRGAGKPRIYPCTQNGKVDGEPVFWTREIIAQKRREMGAYVFAAQCLCDPTADTKQGFKAEWLREFDDKSGEGKGMNKYLLVDPANEKKKNSDYTAMGIIGLGQDGNYYLLDMVRDRLNLGERWDAVHALHRRWKPLGVGYEKYGMQADIDFIKIKQAEENYRFDITELGGQVSKNDRIKRLVPICEEGRFYLPEKIIKVDYEGKTHDLVQVFIEEEYKSFPVGLHDDMLDMIARIMDEDLNAVWPKQNKTESEQQKDRYSRPRRRARTASAWAA